MGLPARPPLGAGRKLSHAIGEWALISRAEACRRINEAADLGLDHCSWLTSVTPQSFFPVARIPQVAGANVRPDSKRKGQREPNIAINVYSHQTEGLSS